MSSPPPFPPPSPTATFPYLVSGQVGEGAMGMVFRAIEPQLGRPVAIKVMKGIAQDEAATREARLRFLQEARAAAALSHPGVATIYRIGEEAGEPWIAMEWLDGETLEQVVANRGPLPAEQVIALGIEIASALGAAHRAGVIHRDIKPANLILLSDGRLKITDFGIARLTHGELVQTQLGYLVATPRFASPEQLRGLAVDGRSDLFSAGVVLFFLLTGRHPFPGHDLMEIISSILLGKTHALRDLAPATPAGLITTIDRALAADPEARFSNADEMATALRALINSGTTSGITSGATLETAVFTNTTSTASPRGVSEPSSLSLPSLPSQPSQPSLPLQPRLYADLPDSPSAAVIAVATTWPARELGAQVPRSLLDRLLDRPLHATPFAGALRLGGDWILIADGQVLAALGASGASGDLVIEALPEKAQAVLHAAPHDPSAGESLVRALAATLGEPHIRHDGLDSSFVNLAALAERLRDEQFTGALALEHRGQHGRVLFANGAQIARLWQRGWDGLPIERPWQELASSVALRARVEEARPRPLAHSFRRALQQIELTVGSRTGAARVEARLDGRTIPAPLAPERDPLVRFLHWSLTSLPAYLGERERAQRWKYLVEWLSEIRTARIYAELPPPSGGAKSNTAPWDLATFDETQPTPRVLHVARRVARATPATLEAFRSAVVEAKLARKATGDIGGAFLIASAIDPETVTLLAEWTRGEGSGKWFGVEESFTRYEGFVRISPRRGFHLLLVRETAGDFAPILPAAV